MSARDTTSSAKSAKKAPSGKKSGAKCPICGKPAVPESRPFCSRRCADVDLNRWLGGHYAIPTAEPPDIEDLDAAERRGPVDDPDG
ncbi:MAG: DNA gyrase inhibitor YacG [Azospirillaceae bacterium]